MKYAFRCPKCQSKHTVEQTMAGKKAKCKCGATMTVPKAPVRKASNAQTPKPLSKIACTGCGAVHDVTAALLGKTVQCGCGAKFTIPDPNATASTKKPVQAAEAIHVTCPGCGFEHQAGQELAGRAVRCGCGATLQVPAAGLEEAGGLGDLLSELPDDDFGLDPLGSSNSLAGSPLANVPTPKTDNQILAQYTQTDDWKHKPSRSSSSGGGGFFALESGIASSGVLGGCLAMLVATVWFFGALAFDWVFFYPPILFAVGLFAVLRDLLGDD